MNDNAYIAKEARRTDEAIMGALIANPEQEVMTLTLDLSQERRADNPLEVNFPFRSLFVRDATDADVEIQWRAASRATFQGVVPIQLNDSFVNPYRMKGYFHWSAQAGKSITLIFFATIEFRPGSQISNTAGGVSISEGASMSHSVVTLAAATATEIVASSSTRKLATIQNNTGSDIWVGTSAVSNTGANLGIQVPAGATFQWRNTAALYGYSVLGGNLVAMVES